jgi:hypothetical protein
VFLTKSDEVTPDVLEAHSKAFKKAKIKTEAISIYDDASLESVKTILNKIAEQKHA